MASHGACQSDWEDTSLHTAVWKNDLATVKALLEPSEEDFQDLGDSRSNQVDSVDRESGWTPLHKALYFGHLSIAALLLAHGARKDAKDPKGRTPIDLITQELACIRNRPELEEEEEEKGTEVLVWGNGANYQLGLGSADIVPVPRRVGHLKGVRVKRVAASKFHTVALGSAGEVYTWGWGRGGRLGHPKVNLVANEAAQIYPMKVKGLRGKVVVDVAAAKHHTLAVTAAGEVFSWGSNHDGKLGYQSVGVQGVPKKVMFLKGVMVQKVGAANRHSVGIAEDGLVYTWGANSYGQLGYGTSDSGSNPMPRPVESMRKKVVTGISASKHHNVVVTKDGEVYSWGHKCVNPQKLRFHKLRAAYQTSSGEEVHVHRDFDEVHRPFVQKVAAGVVHSSCVTKGGRVLVWNSADPDLEAEPVEGVLSSRNAVSVSAGKLVTAVVDKFGGVYTWEAQQQDSRVRVSNKDKIMVAPERVSGITAAADVWVGEKHTVALQCWDQCCGPLLRKQRQSGEELSGDESSEGSKDMSSTHVIPGESLSEVSGSFGCLATDEDSVVSGKRALPRLQDLCETAVALHVLEPRNAIQILMFADYVGAKMLKMQSLQLAVLNVDFVMAEAGSALADVPSQILLEIEKGYKCKVLSSQLNLQQEAWWLDASGGFDADVMGKRPTAFCSQDYSQEGSLLGSLSHQSVGSMVLDVRHRLHKGKEGGFMADRRPTEAVLVGRLVRNVTKKLQQISILEDKQVNGVPLDEQQLCKIAQKKSLEEGLAHLQAGSSYATVQEILAKDNQIGSKKLGRTSGDNVKDLGDGGSDMDLVGSRKVSRMVEERQRKGGKIDGNILAGEAMEKEKKRSCAVRSVGFSVVSSADSQLEDKPKRRNGNGKGKGKGKRGGLSAFLSGELERPEPSPQILEPMSGGPAWEVQPVGSVGASLTDIMQQEESCSGKKKHKEIEAALPIKTPMKHGASQISLVDFMTKPKVAKKSGPAWGGVGTTPPKPSTPSLHDIQVEQEVRKRGWPCKVKGVSSKSRWYVPDEPAVQDMRAIQIEEKAVQEIGKLYKCGTVRVVEGSATSKFKGNNG